MKCSLFMAKSIDFKSIFIFTVKLKVTTESKYLCKEHFLQGKPKEGIRYATTNHTVIPKKMQINHSRCKWGLSNEI